MKKENPKTSTNYKIHIKLLPTYLS